MAGTQQRKSSRPTSRSSQDLIRATFLISAICCLLAIWLGTLASPWDDEVVDAWMRLRYALRYEEDSGSHSEISVLAVDSTTLREKGAWGKGDWMTRKPFADQMRCFSEYFSPTVIAYDFLLQNPLATADDPTGIAEPVSLSTGALAQVTAELERLRQIAALPGDSASIPGMDYDVIRHINRLSVEQGDHRVRAELVALMRARRSAVLLAYSLIGGAGDPENLNPLSWRPEQIAGPDGDPEGGTAITYLDYMAIPAEWIHGGTEEGALAANANMPSPMFVDYVDLGYVNVPREVDGVLRRLPLVLGYKYTAASGQEVIRYVPSFALSAVLRHLGVPFPLEPEDGQAAAVEVRFGDRIVIHGGKGRDVEVPIDARGFMYLNYARKLNDYDAIPLSRLAPDYSGRDEGGRDEVVRYRPVIDNRIVIVAPVATALGDIGPTAIEVPVPLVYVHLVAMSNILDGRSIGEWPRAVDWLVVVSVAVLFLCISLFVRRTVLPLASLLFLALLVTGHYLTIHYHWQVLPFFGPVFHVGLASFSILAHRYFTEERSRRTIRRMFSTMVSDRVLEFLEENPDSFSLAGKAADATVFFSDVAGFTQIGETLDPERLSQLINRYMTPVTDCILEHGGYLDKYIGDGIMAVWGVPFPAERHAAEGCRAALRQQVLIAENNLGIQAEFGVSLSVRMGLNSGQVTAGNMGSERKFQYTVMGDNVNLAARIEAVNKDYGTSIMVSEKTMSLAGDEFLFRLIDRVQVVGRTRYVSVYELMDFRSSAALERVTLAGEYASALQQYFDREWNAAAASFDSILTRFPEDGPSLEMLRRISEFKQKPPAEAWGGVHIRLTK